MKLKINLDAKVRNYFGPEVPKSLSQIKTISSNGYFVLFQTEFRFDSTLLGFELYAYQTGSIIFYVINKISIFLFFIFMLIFFYS